MASIQRCCSFTQSMPRFRTLLSSTVHGRCFSTVLNSACPPHSSALRDRRHCGAPPAANKRPGWPVQSRNFSSVWQVLPDAYLWVHQATGLPWWVVICAGAIAIRLPVYLLMPIVADRQARRLHAMNFVQGETSRLLSSMEIQRSREQLSNEQTSKEFEKAAKKLQKDTIRRHSCQVWKMFFHIPVLVPLWILNSFAIRELVVNCELDLRCALLAHQGPFFCTDLLAPHVSLNLLMCISMLWLIELPLIMKARMPVDPPLLGLKEFTALKQPFVERFLPVWNAMGRVTAVSLVLLYANFPGALTLSILTGSASMAVLNTTIQVPAVRRFFKIFPTPAESYNLPQDISKHFTAKWKWFVEVQRAEDELRKENQRRRRAKWLPSSVNNDDKEGDKS